MAEAGPPLVRQEIVAASTANTAAATNSAAAITYAAVPGSSHAVTDGIAWSYAGSGTLSGGGLTVTADGATVFSLDISSKADGFVPFRASTGVNEALVITLADGGANVDGKVNVLGYARLRGAPIGVHGVFDFSDYAASGLIATI